MRDTCIYKLGEMVHDWLTIPRERRLRSMVTDHHQIVRYLPSLQKSTVRFKVATLHVSMSWPL